MKGKASDRAELLPVLGEVFRAHGYEGASLSLISEATGLGKGSLYHFFPDGKQQMAAEVLAEIDHWFEANIFAPLRSTDDPVCAVDAMVKSTDDYFRSGRRVCLVGVVALGAARDIFNAQVQSYFTRWQDALTATLRRSGMSTTVARRRSEDALVTIQGALVLARARDDAKIFTRAMAELKPRLLAK
jgi:TetR/AcrR family transcriptional regulator, lmrAB and yxaGH operons repressor